MKKDTQIQKDVMNELMWDPSIDHLNIGVSVLNGVVTLDGDVKTFAEKQNITRAAQRVTEVKAVVEKINIKHSGPQGLFFSDDQKIAKAIVNKFELSSFIPNDRIKVKVEEGLVTLSGEVMWSYQSKAAEKLVKDFLGVKTLRNKIIVNPKMEARDIKEKIELALKKAEEQASGYRYSEEQLEGSDATHSGVVNSFVENKKIETSDWGVPT
jgi:osmotically-inducible protein OsmY